jgi:two-component system, chemotaxis family, sensor kinase CheA
MKPRDELVAAFFRSTPNRVAEATELWLSFEQGESAKLPALRRLLHTLKGEAHVLQLAECAQLAELAESVVDQIRRSGEVTALSGDAVLGAFEAVSFLAHGEREEELDLTEVTQSLRAAIAELSQKPDAPKVEDGDGRGGGADAAKAPRAPAKVEEEAAPEAARSAIVSLDPETIQALVHEMRRLYSEQEIFHNQLRETQRMLRALLAEIDPSRAGPNLVERITKTLGYGSEIDRQLRRIRADWSSNGFSFGLALDELDDSVRKASVVTTDRLENQVRRVGRSTARALNKDVEFRVRGDTILDAGVERRLEPALLHLVRNAVDHGIESKELRRKRGKPERGLVTVTISQSESTVRARVTDDGGGVDFDRLREVLAPIVPNVETLGIEDLLRYVFEQGVTTRQEVSSISGRGVGLDVVAREIGAAGGQVVIESTSLEGTSVLIAMSTTLRGEIAVPIVAGKYRYALPSRSIATVIRPESIERSSDSTWIRVDVEGESTLVPLYALEALLGRGGEPDARRAAIVLQHAAGLFAVSVDSFGNPRPITIRRSEELPFCPELVRGVAPTADGGALLLLNVDALHSVARQMRAAPKAASAKRQDQERRVLVVEDAPVARELLCGIMRSLGLRVEEAKDGREGLMRAHRSPPDVVLTDIEMPYMDGIEMITEFRRSNDLAQIPVIVLTTAANEANKLSLERLGVRAVLSKQRFVEDELRRLIEECVGAT